MSDFMKIEIVLVVKGSYFEACYMGKLPPGDSHLNKNGSGDVHPFN
jgi:hypothetical protein